MRRILCGLLLCVVPILPVMAFAQFNHQVWDELLHANVRAIDGGQVTQVDYAGMSRDAALLAAYLHDVAAVSRPTFERWSEAEQLAFLINVYNAATVAIVLTEYPAIDSIRDIGSLFRPTWSRAFVSLFGSMVALDNIEHDMIRGWNIYNEPKIHFAVNCAAIGCPPLRAEAYVGQKLQQQLDANTRLFLADRSRNYFEGNRIYISKIFDWYAEDFEKGWQGIDSVAEFLAAYSTELELDSEQQRALETGQVAIRYLNYDWKLNRIP